MTLVVLSVLTQVVQGESGLVMTILRPASLCKVFEIVPVCVCVLRCVRDQP